MQMHLFLFLFINLLAINHTKAGSVVSSSRQQATVGPVPSGSGVHEQTEESDNSSDAGSDDSDSGINVSADGSSFVHSSADITNFLRRQCTPDNHISINAKNFPLNENDSEVSVRINGRDFSVNGITYSNQLKEKNITIFQDKKIRDVNVDVPLKTLTGERSTTQRIHFTCNGNLYCDQEQPLGRIRILCVDVKKDENTSINFITSSRGYHHIINYNNISRGNLSIHESPMRNVYFVADGNLEVNGSAMEQAQMNSGGDLNIIGSPMGSTHLKCGGDFNVLRSRMQVGQINCGGDSAISHSPMGNLQLRSGGDSNIIESSADDANISCGGSLYLHKSKMKNGSVRCGGDLSTIQSPLENVRVSYGGSRFY